MVEVVTEAVDAPSVSTAAADADVLAVRRALAALGPLDREVVVLRWRDLLGLDEIAALTDATTGQVVQRLRRSAMAIEGAAGSSVVHCGHPLDDRDEDAVIEDLQLGVTPQLACRLRTVLASGDGPAADRTVVHRRWVRLLTWARRHDGGLLAVLVIGVDVALAAVASGALA